MKTDHKYLKNHCLLLSKSSFSIDQNTQGINHQWHQTETHYSQKTCFVPKKVEYYYSGCLIQESFNKMEGLFQDRWEIYPKLSPAKLLKNSKILI